MGAVGGFFGKPLNRRVLYLALISLFAAGQFVSMGLARRTMIFYSMEGTAVVEERMLRRSGSQEEDIRKYLEEVCLGPLSSGSAPLFPKGTRVRTLLFRNGVVYADLTESAALPSLEGGDVRRSLAILRAGLHRNFSYVKEVRLFINGTKAYQSAPLDQGGFEEGAEFSGVKNFRVFSKNLPKRA